MASARNRIRVLARFRPLNADEQLFGSENRVQVGNNFKSVGVQGQIFAFDRIFDGSSTQQQIYEYSGQPIVSDFLRGYSSAILVYGQTGSGKTHTMHGNATDHGIVQRALSQIFSQAETLEATAKPDFSVSFYEVYLEKIYDLLDTTKQNLRIRFHPTTGTYIEDLTEKPVHSASDAISHFALGLKNRTTSATKMNIDSSRSHAIFCIRMTLNSNDGTVTKCSLMLVDLAGSESGAEAGSLAMDQQRKINLSLTSLGKVIFSLTEATRSTSDSLSSPTASAPNLSDESSLQAPLTPDQKADRRVCYVTKIAGSNGNVSASSTPNLSTPARHVPYRDSKLTRLLSDALGGHSRTCLILCASSSLKFESETLSTLRFGQRAKLVKNDCVPQKFNSPGNNSTPNVAMQQLYSRLHSLQQQLADSQPQVDPDHEVDKLKASMDEITQERDLLKDQNQFLRQRLVSNKENMDVLETKVSPFSGICEQLAKVERLYSTQLEEMEDMVDQLRLQLQGIVAQSKSESTESREKLQDILRDYEDSLVQVETMRHNVLILEQRCADKDKRIAELEKLLRSTQTRSVADE